MTSYGFGFGQSGRHCVRCGKELTDAASMLVGVGPVCRKLDNALLAQAIPSDLPKAVEAYKSVDVGTLPPETISTFLKIESALIAADALYCLDWRETVKLIEWICSWGGTPSCGLMNIVSALGYVGLVAMWKGEAASGQATISFAEGRLFVSGPKNKAFRFAIKKVAGWKFHPSKMAGERPSWSLPHTQAQAFEKLIVTHYPNHTPMTEALNAASVFHPVEPPMPPQFSGVPLPTPVLNPPAAYVSVSPEGLLLVKTPYNVAFLDMLKCSIPYGKRGWDPVSKVWKVAAEFKPQVLKALSQFFPLADVSAVL